MVTATHFTDLVKSAYLFLEEDFGFHFVGTDEIPRIIEVRYRKDEFMVIVIYSRANNYIEVDICDNASLVQPPTRYKYCTMLMSLVRDKNREVNYDDIMPTKIPLEESVSQTAALLKYYGAELLSRMMLACFLRLITHHL